MVLSLLIVHQLWQVTLAFPVT